MHLGVLHEPRSRPDVTMCELAKVEEKSQRSLPGCCLAHLRVVALIPIHTAAAVSGHNHHLHSLEILTMSCALQCDYVSPTILQAQYCACRQRSPRYIQDIAAWERNPHASLGHCSSVKLRLARLVLPQLPCLAWLTHSHAPPRSDCPHSRSPLSATETGCQCWKAVFVPSSSMKTSRGFRPDDAPEFSFDRVVDGGDSATPLLSKCLVGQWQLIAADPICTYPFTAGIPFPCFSNPCLLLRSTKLYMLRTSSTVGIRPPIH